VYSSRKHIPTAMYRWYVLIALIFMLVISVSVAQDANPNALISGEAVSTAIDPDNIARVFTFDVNANDTVSIIAASENGMALAMLVTDELGSTLAQAVDSNASGTVSVVELSIPQTGTYFLTVFAAPEVFSPKQGPFNIEVTVEPADVVATDATPVPETDAVVQPEVTEVPTTAGTAEPLAATPVTTVDAASPTSNEQTQVLISGGMEVTLSWDAPVDMNLEVRDPNGDSLFWNSRSSAIGGSFGFDANGLCEILVDQPVETASWAAGFVPTGSYEILVFYRQACDAPNPVAFTVTTVVNGQELEPITGTLPPPQPNQDSVYVARFEVDGNEDQFTNAFTTPGGVYTDASLNILPAPPAEIQANAQTIGRDAPVQGFLNSRQPYVSYSFTGTQNELVGIEMTALSGSLDTLLQVMDSAGNIISVNDDFSGTDSSIPNLRLAVPDTYYIVATRYGKELGGTQGEYTLTLSGPSASIPAEVQALNLPQGDIEISLIWNSNADLQLLVRDPAGEPVFDDNPNAISGGILAEDGNVNCVPAEGLPISYIYWPLGFLRPGSYEVEVWYQADCNDPTPVEFTLTTVVNGQAIAVEQQRPALGQRFVMSLNIGQDGNASAGLGGFVGGSETINYQAELSSATAIPVGQEVFGNLSAANTFDVYTFEGRAGDIVTVNMSAVASTLDTKLFLISPSGIEIAENDDAVVAGADRTTNSVINQLLLPEDGQYVIVATRYATIYGGTVGGYSLTLRQS